MSFENSNIFNPGRDIYGESLVDHLLNMFCIHSLGGRDDGVWVAALEGLRSSEPQVSHRRLGEGNAIVCVVGSVAGLCLAVNTWSNKCLFSEIVDFW